MPTSGTFNWTQTRDQLCRRALAKVGNSNPTVNEITDAAEIMNSILKSWQNDCVYVWTQKWESKPLDTPSSVVLGTDGKNYTCIMGHTSSVDNKPVTGSDWPTFWIERGTGGAIWAPGVGYSSIGDFNAPLDTILVESAYIRDGHQDTPLEIHGLHGYMGMVDKTFTGTPTVLLFDADLVPRIAVWPIPERTSYVLHYLRVQVIEDFNQVSDLPDAPSRWNRAIIYQLAADLSDDYGINVQERGFLQQKADRLLIQARVGNRADSAGNVVAPSYRVRRR